MSSRKALDERDFQRLLALRDGLRRFLRWSEHEAKAVGLTPAQHQLLLAAGRIFEVEPGDVLGDQLLGGIDLLPLAARTERSQHGSLSLEAGDFASRFVSTMVGR